MDIYRVNKTMEIQNVLDQPAFIPPANPASSPPPIVENPLGNSQVATPDAIAPIEGDQGTIFSGVA